MNKKLHIFLFLLFILIIFYFLKDIEPFGNQILLQPGLSFDSRDTTIISLQENPVIDNSANTESRGNEITTSAETISTSRRLPSAVEERGEPSYAVFDDTSSNIDYLSTDFNSREEIELLNERLDELKFKSELFLSEGAKRKCTIPYGYLHEEGGDSFDYDYFTENEDNISKIICNTETHSQEQEVSIDGGNCGINSTEFDFRGCTENSQEGDGDGVAAVERDGVSAVERDGTDTTDTEIKQCSWNTSNIYGVEYRYQDLSLDIPEANVVDVDIDWMIEQGSKDEDAYGDYNFSCPVGGTLPGESPEIKCDENFFTLSGCKQKCILNPDNMEGYTINGHPITNELIENDIIQNVHFFDPVSEQIAGHTIGCNEDLKYYSVDENSPSLTCNNSRKFEGQGCLKHFIIPKDLRQGFTGPNDGVVGGGGLALYEPNYQSLSDGAVIIQGLEEIPEVDGGFRVRLDIPVIEFKCPEGKTGWSEEYDINNIETDIVEIRNALVNNCEPDRCNINELAANNSGYELEVKNSAHVVSTRRGQISGTDILERGTATEDEFTRFININCTDSGDDDDNISVRCENDKFVYEGCTEKCPDGAKYDINAAICKCTDSRKVIRIESKDIDDQGVAHAVGRILGGGVADATDGRPNIKDSYYCGYKKDIINWLDVLFYRKKEYLRAFIVLIISINIGVCLLYRKNFEWYNYLICMITVLYSVALSVVAQIWNEKGKPQWYTSMYQEELLIVISLSLFIILIIMLLNHVSVMNLDRENFSTAISDVPAGLSHLIFVIIAVQPIKDIDKSDYYHGKYKSCPPDSTYKTKEDNTFYCKCDDPEKIYKPPEGKGIWSTPGKCIYKENNWFPLDGKHYFFIMVTAIFSFLFNFTSDFENKLKILIFFVIFLGNSIILFIYTRKFNYGNEESEIIKNEKCGEAFDRGVECQPFDSPTKIGYPKSDATEVVCGNNSGDNDSEDNDSPYCDLRKYGRDLKKCCITEKQCKIPEGYIITSQDDENNENTRIYNHESEPVDINKFNFLTAIISCDEGNGYILNPAGSPEQTIFPHSSEITCSKQGGEDVFDLNNVCIPTKTCSIASSNIPIGYKINVESSNEDSSIKEYLFYHEGGALVTEVEEPVECKWNEGDDEGNTYYYRRINAEEAPSMTCGDNGISFQGCEPQKCKIPIPEGVILKSPAPRAGWLGGNSFVRHNDGDTLRYDYFYNNDLFCAGENQVSSGITDFSIETNLTIPDPVCNLPTERPDHDSNEEYTFEFSFTDEDDNEQEEFPDYCRRN